MTPTLMPLRRRLAVFAFSLVAAVPLVVTVFNLREEARLERLLGDSPKLFLDGTVVRSGQRESDGSRAVYAEYTWTFGGASYRGASRLNIPDVVRPGPGDRIILMSEPGDPSFAVPTKLFREPGRLGRLRLLAAVFTVPPVLLWALLGWVTVKAVREGRAGRQAVPGREAA